MDFHSRSGRDAYLVRAAGDQKTPSRQCHLAHKRFGSESLAVTRGEPIRRRDESGDTEGESPCCTEEFSTWAQHVCDTCGFGTEDDYACAIRGSAAVPCCVHVFDRLDPVMFLPECVVVTTGLGQARRNPCRACRGSQCWWSTEPVPHGQV